MNIIELEQKLEYIFGAGREGAERTKRQIVEAFEEARDGGGASRQIQAILMGGLVVDTADEQIAKLTPLAKQVHDIVLERNKLRRAMGKADAELRTTLMWAGLMDAQGNGSPEMMADAVAGIIEEHRNLSRSVQELQRNPPIIEETDDRRTVRQITSMLQGLPIAVAELTPTARATFESFEAYHKEKALGADHQRTIQMLRQRCTEHTRREQQLEDKVRAVVDEANKLATPFRERGKKIEQLQKLVERYRKRGNVLAETARKLEKETYRTDDFDLELTESEWGRIDKMIADRIEKTLIDRSEVINDRVGGIVFERKRIADWLRNSQGRHRGGYSPADETLADAVMRGEHER